MFFSILVPFPDKEHVEADGWSNKIVDQDICSLILLSLRNSQFASLLADLKCIARQQTHMYTRVIANGSDLYSSNYD